MANYPYNPYTNNMPYGLTPTVPISSFQMSQTQELIRVTGIDGAKAYQMPPNSVVPLFDANNDIMYIKSTDGAGFPSIRAFSFAPIDTATAEPTEYIQRPEFDALVEQVKELINNAEQPVSSTK